MIGRREVFKMLALLPVVMAGLPRTAIAQIKAAVAGERRYTLIYHGDSSGYCDLEILDGDYRGRCRSGDLRNLAKDFLRIADAREERRSYVVDIPADRALPGHGFSVVFDAHGGFTSSEPSLSADHPHFHYPMQMSEQEAKLSRWWDGDAKVYREVTQRDIGRGVV